MAKRRLSILLLFLLIIFTLTGCDLIDNARDSFNNWLKEQIVRKSGITEDESYLQARENEEAGLLNDAGEYVIEEGIDIEEMLEGKIHVTFAENSNLKIAYYYDEDQQTMIDVTACYLNPGDIIYFSDVEERSTGGGKYIFDGFRFIEYDKNGKRIGETDKVYENNRKIVISEDFTGSELAVEPVGRFVK